MKQQLVALNRGLRAYYRREQARGSKLSQVDVVTMLTIQAKKKSPSLNGVKGAKTRHLTPFALELVKDMVDNGPANQKAFWQRREDMLRPLVAFYESMSQDPYRPETTALCAQAFATAYGKLTHEVRLAGRRGRRPYKPRPKLHLMMELANQCFEFGSPREFWAYADEGFLSKVKRIAMKSPQPRKMEANVILRLRLLQEAGALDA